jgi:hypothetical protein
VTCYGIRDDSVDTVWKRVLLGGAVREYDMAVYVFYTLQLCLVESFKGAVGGKLENSMSPLGSERMADKLFQGPFNSVEVQCPNEYRVS